MSDKRSAPHRLDLVIDFVNTADADSGELVEGPADLTRWLTGRELMGSGEQAGPEDYERALALREALRAAMLANNGGPEDEPANAQLEAAARRGELSVHFRDGSSLLEPCVGGPYGALAALLVPVAEAMSDGTWRRVKACRADDCHWAFYDFSRNRSGTWCDMAVCGNREKVRAYRARAGS
ncbi:MAG TPA: CGNR zinc finger domain-containing protein [Solirubrobacteraceae bacterium]|jgi:predicted RNA-binding Zn ribbon-like protein|nr:CGNR zinc finger domain-containing protein [Solirubrobacteraceae bacterium]